MKTMATVVKKVDEKLYKVRLADGRLISAILSGKKKLMLKRDLLPGDEIRVELSPYDSERCLINPKR